MAVIKNEKTGKWEVRTYYEDWTGERKQKTKRGFEKKQDAVEWERAFKLQKHYDMSMTFSSFVEVYSNDMKPRLRLNTWNSKEHIIRTKILPYFKNKKMSEITPSDIVNWQNELLNYRNSFGEGYSKTYLKTIHNQLSAILNHAVNLYGLRSNAARRAGNMGKEETGEMRFWTQEEYETFVEKVADKEETYMAFEILYWCGVRLGELLALTPEDFDLEKNSLRINKSLQRIHGEDVITDPKTPKSRRVIIMPEFLTLEVKEYLSHLYKVGPTDRIFCISKSFLHHEMDRGVKLSGVKRIRIHDLRHSHVSLLINMGFSALAIGNRVGHEAVDITYRYAHLFPSIQTEMASELNKEREAILNVAKEQR
ncbi:site-specific integrase [Clostridium vitabionis]|uniref:site-specific integrase n=1 Tax=Clostridium vitabionis TaxID=2784388 RepID=UPI00188A6F6F|nr:site-specific integrase [Clostridium vitabionis]